MKLPLQKMIVIADPHYYSKTLGITGRAYQLRSESDQKCLGESEEIVDAAFAEIAKSDCDAVLIAGDLTDNGERVCHEEFRSKLYELQKTKPVYVITATHDWCCDKNPRRFEGENVYHDVPVLNHDELRDFYKDFGPEKAESEFFTHLGTSSYAVNLSDKVKILCLNDDQSGMGGAGFSEEHFKWIEAQLADAKQKDMTVISMQHHLLLDHIHPMISGGGMSVKDEHTVSARLADAGLKFSFVGHSHMTDTAKITTEKGNTLYEVNVGSICGYPAPMAEVTVYEDEITVHMHYLKSFSDVDNAQEFLKEHALNLINKTLQGVAYGRKKEFVDRITAMQGNGEKMLKYRPLLKPAAKFIDKLTVKKAVTILNTLFFGTAVRKKDAEPYYDEKVMDITKEIFLNIFDGCRHPHPESSEYFRLVTSVISLPQRFAKQNKVLKQIPELVQILITGTELNQYPVNLK